MLLVRYASSSAAEPQLGVLQGDVIHSLPADVGQLHNMLTRSRADILRAATSAGAGTSVPAGDVTLLPLIDTQEIWAAGVTYLRSQEARMSESADADVYDRVYDADRPEIFFKGTGRRLRAGGNEVTIRTDSTWDVPEPELALLINAHAEIVGFGVGNDVSSRSIEGENPLYLPQAKI